MSITKKSISRRTVLRGIGAGLAVPVLDGRVSASAAINHVETADAEAQYRLGLKYHYRGDSLRRRRRRCRRGEPDKWFRLAVRWLQVAADQGHTLAQVSVGWYYLTGRGVVQDDTEAARWYRRAATQGNAWAQHNLLIIKLRRGLRLAQSQDDVEEALARCRVKKMLRDERGLPGHCLQGISTHKEFWLLEPHRTETGVKEDREHQDAHWRELGEAQDREDQDAYWRELRYEERERTFKAWKQRGWPLPALRLG